MKSVKDTLLERRSTRRYERQSISQSNLNLIYAAIRNTPTSYNGQQFSVIDVSDQETKIKLYELTNQKQIKTCNRFLLFCADYNKIATIAKAKEIEMPPFSHTADGVMVGIIDASLAMMSAVVAAESCGLGTCCIGYARTAAPKKIAELLKLPKGVFAVCGLAIGVPREINDLKPKQSKELIIHSNYYRTDDMTSDLLEYDNRITQYNITRSGTTSDNDWASHIIDYYREAMNYQMLDALRSQGYDVIK
ncbi:MAG: NADPH-dependent oxidoreductase [Bacteroidales bacterium]|nr:NADPH-dependent oxidoreductase [Bacteroidales bacterium]